MMAGLVTRLLTNPIVLVNELPVGFVYYSVKFGWDKAEEDTRTSRCICPTHPYISFKMFTTADNINMIQQWVEKGLHTVTVCDGDDYFIFKNAYFKEYPVITFSKDERIKIKIYGKLITGQ